MKNLIFADRIRFVEQYKMPIYSTTKKNYANLLPLTSSILLVFWEWHFFTFDKTIAKVKKMIELAVLQNSTKCWRTLWFNLSCILQPKLRKIGTVKTIYREVWWDSDANPIEPIPALARLATKIFWWILFWLWSYKRKEVVWLTED